MNKTQTLCSLLAAVAICAHAGTMTLYTSAGKQYTYDLASVGKISFDSAATKVSAIQNPKVAVVSPIGIKAVGSTLKLAAAPGTDLRVEIHTLDGRLAHQFHATIGKDGQASVGIAKVLGNGLYVAIASSATGKSSQTLFHIVR